MGIGKITRNYQVTIPKDIRLLNDIKVGDTIFFTTDNGKINLTKVKKKSIIDNAFGILKSTESGIKYVNKSRKEWKTREKRFEK